MTTVMQLWIVCLILFHHVVVSNQQVADSKQYVIRDKRQAAFAQQLAEYEIVVPERVTYSGIFVSHDLHPANGGLQRRSKRSPADDVHFRVRVGDDDLHLELRPNSGLVAPAGVVERRSGHLANATTARIKTLRDAECHFHGVVRNHTESLVAVSACNGLRGMLKTSNGEYFIEPVKDHGLKSGHPHLLYKRSALPLKEKEHTEGTCGTKENFRRAIRKRNRWERKQNGRTAKGRGRRQRRSVSTEKNVETLVVADKMMMDYYSNEDIETYILTVMNMVSALYRDASIGNAINVVLVRMVLLENEESEKQEDLSISHHADNTLKSFCKWQKFINPKDEGHPNHHDVAILLTRYNICTRMNEPCSTLGLAEVAGMCQPHRSCNINEDTGLALAYTIAHEMGHNFGMNHDGPHNGCQAPYGERQHVMSPHLNSDTSPLVWSNCSRQEITKFLDRDWGSCLDDEPSEHEFHFPQLPPGAMYDADHQCRLQYGPDASYCHGIEDVCLTLWCRLENKCVTRLEPAAPGTQCGKHKWCFMGQCTLMGERPEAIDGEWGQWSEWTQCSRTCGAGISMAVRHCDNPAPANGGRYCIGERKRYRVCNTEPCAEGAASFRTVQCAKHNTIPYKEELHNWTPVSTPLTPCQLHCKPEGKFFSVMLEDSVIDGTPCNPGTRDLCINGKCRRVSCDWGIDSNAQEDRCGICHGDGTQCQTIRGEFTQEEGVGYVEAIQVPKWSRNIRVEELEEANNYIAVKEGGENDGEYYLNGNWFIQWSGEFRAAGSTIYYRREGEKETIHIPGPIKEDLHIMLLYQTTNPGLKFEYTVPNANITRKPEFHWEYTDWTVCTTTCGGGTQVSSARCMEKEAGLVEDKYCNSTEKPPDVTRVCNKHQCPARWWAGPWQHCSISCGNKGVRRRTVICIRSFGADEQIALLDQDCDGQRKPNEVEPCQHRQPCPGDIYWQTGPWSDTCRGDPCNNQTRKVWCSLEGGPCDDQPKPFILRQCGNISCGLWTAGSWSECSQSCGEGVQFRRVMCEGGLKCLDANEPESIRICNRSCHQHPYHPHNHHSDTNESNGAPSWHTTEATHTLLEPVENLHEDNSVTLRTVTETRIVATDPADQEGSGHPDAVPSRATEGSTDKENHDGDRSKDVVEDKINPDDFQVIEIGNQPSPKDRYEVLSDQWFKEGVDIMDYKSSVANTQKNEYQSDSMPSSDHEEENAIGTDYVKKYKVQMKPHFEWRIGEWNQCSRPCDGGHRSREILCFEMTTQTLVDSDLCDPHARPLYMETCNLDACQEWELSDWSQCSATCDEGIKTRSVKCPQPSKCNLETKPKEQMPCQVKACITWIAGPWSQCPVTCGGGYQVRHVKCVNHTSQEPATGCDLSHRPIHRQHCNLDECPQDQSAKFSTCHDKLETKLCQSLRHMCSTWYFKVKCCHTCNKRGSHKTSNNSYKRKSS